MENRRDPWAKPTAPPHSLDGHRGDPGQEARNNGERECKRVESEVAVPRASVRYSGSHRCLCPPTGHEIVLSFHSRPGRGIWGAWPESQQDGNGCFGIVERSWYTPEAWEVCVG